MHCFLFILSSVVVSEQRLSQNPFSLFRLYQNVESYEVPDFEQMQNSNALDPTAVNDDGW